MARVQRHFFAVVVLERAADELRDKDLILQRSHLEPNLTATSQCCHPPRRQSRMCAASSQRDRP